MDQANKDRSYLEKAISAAVRAGARILEIYNQPDVKTGYKEDHSPLTEADTASHLVLKEVLSVCQLPILSEEGQHASYEERSSWADFWLIDPLDGTREFIKRNDEFTVNVALIRHGSPVIGVVYVPVPGHLYFASDAVGSFKAHCEFTGQDQWPDLKEWIERAEKLPSSSTKKYTILASRSHRNQETELFIKQLEKEYGDISVVSRGSALKFCSMAEGNADIYPRFAPTMEWDTAAGQCVAMNAGCSVTRKDTGATLTYNKADLLNPWFIVKRPVEQDPT